MKRLIEIEDDTFNKQGLKIETDELPLKINYLYKSESNNKIIIDKADTETDYGEYQFIICAYIAQDEGHLFFQINNDVLKNKNITVYHNNERVEKSVWLKSGDVIKISDKVIHYQVMGDIIKIKVGEENSKTNTDFNLNNLRAPSSQSLQNEQDKINTDLPRVEVPAFETSTSKKSKLKKTGFISLSIVLILIAFFILQAEMTSIVINPKADKLEIKGLFPIVPIAQRYMMIRGDYEINATKKDYHQLNKTIKVDEDNKIFNFNMIELPGIVEINIESDGNNNISIDNIVMLKMPTSEKNQYEIKKGVHTLKITNPRYKDFEQKINVAGKNKLQLISVSLAPNWGMLKIISKTKNINIKISTNNKEIEITNLTQEKEIELIKNEYTIEISKEKFKSITMSITIGAQENKILVLDELIPEDGVLIVNSEPEASIIRIDGKYMGKTPQTIKLRPGEEHGVELSLSGYQLFKTSINLEAEEEINIKPTLSIKKGIVFISISPEKAHLYIDGKSYNNTTGKFTLSAKEHHIVVKAKGYKTQSKHIKGMKQSQNISFNLKKIVTNKKATTNTLNKSRKNKVTHSNSINQIMRLVKPVQFVMGSKKNEPGRGSNEREYQVKLDYAYFLAEKEVSNKQFKKYLTSHRSGSVSGNSQKSLALSTQPVVNVTWDEAARFANWLSKKEGLNQYYQEIKGKMKAIDRDKKINGYRLPFEAEWAYAARGNKQKKYPWSGNFPPINFAGNFADESAKSYVSNIIEGYNDQYAVSSPVGQFKKNEQGFYDLGGNVSEWCQDYYSPFVSSGGVSSGGRVAGSKEIIINPKGPSKGTHRVVRDSSWRDSSIRELRLSYRSYSKKKANDIGFRLARYAL